MKMTMIITTNQKILINNKITIIIIIEIKVIKVSHSRGKSSKLIRQGYLTNKMVIIEESSNQISEDNEKNNNLLDNNKTIKKRTI